MSDIANRGALPRLAGERRALKICAHLETDAGHRFAWTGHSAPMSPIYIRAAFALAAAAFEPQLEIADYLREHDAEIASQLAGGPLSFRVGVYRCTLDPGHGGGMALSWRTGEIGWDATISAPAPVRAGPIDLTESVRGLADVVGLGCKVVKLTPDSEEVEARDPWTVASVALIRERPE